ncbi:MAG TPA: hypothetical protein VLW50_00935 [Streptosporangiaceae bacterium]|nr:hypothetical protein [Streptosporangiaceae bacterium]
MYDVPWAGLVIGISFVIAAAVAFMGEVSSKKRWGELMTLRLGPANWDFSNSWGSTFAAVGALLGTVLSAGVLTGTNTRLMSSGGYAGCNLFFGGLVVIAPFVFTATRKKDPTEPAPDGSGVAYDGAALFFLVASAVTLWAVIGELWVVMLIMWEFLHGPVAVCCIALLCAVELLVCYYGQSSIRNVLTVQAITQAAHQSNVDSIIATVPAAAARPALVRRKQSWTVL